MKLPKWKNLSHKQKAWTLVGVPTSIVWMMGMLVNPVTTLILTFVIGSVISVAIGLLMLMDM